MRSTAMIKTNTNTLVRCTRWAAAAAAAESVSIEESSVEQELTCSSILTTNPAATLNLTHDGRIDVIIIIKEEEEYGSAAAICLLLLLLPTAEIVYNRPTEFFFLNVQNEKKDDVTWRDETRRDETWVCTAMAAVGDWLTGALQKRRNNLLSRLSFCLVFPCTHAHTLTKSVVFFSFPFLCRRRRCYTTTTAPSTRAKRQPHTHTNATIT